MAHLDPDLIALEALGERAASPAQQEHLVGCAQCRGELDELRAVVRIARTGSSVDRPVPAPARVWDAVRSDLALGEGPAGARPAIGDQGREAGRGTRPAGGAAPTAGLRVVHGPEPGAGRRRARRVGLAGAAAVAVVLIGAGLTRLLPDAEEGARVLASAELTPLPGVGAAGTAQLLDGTEGRALAVEVHDLPAADGYLEVWLLDPPARRLISLGVLGTGRGTFRLPSGLDLAAYPVVDVSREPLDGVPEHSGQSLVRGTLPARG